MERGTPEAHRLNGAPMKRTVPCVFLPGVLLLALLACDDGDGGGDPFAQFFAEEKKNYDFAACDINLPPASDDGFEDLDACEACCEPKGFDEAAVFSGDCGCAYRVEDREVCDGRADEACGDCCDAAGFNGSFWFGSGDTSSCTCTRTSKTRPAGAGADAGQ